MAVPGLVGQVGHPTDGGALHDDAPGLDSTADHLLRPGNVPTLSDGQKCLGSALMISGLSAKCCAAFELHMAWIQCQIIGS